MLKTVLLLSTILLINKIMFRGGVRIDPASARNAGMIPDKIICRKETDGTFPAG